MKHRDAQDNGTSDEFIEAGFQKYCQLLLVGIDALVERAHDGEVVRPATLSCKSTVPSIYASKLIYRALDVTVGRTLRCRAYETPAAFDTTGKRHLCTMFGREPISPVRSCICALLGNRKEGPHGRLKIGAAVSTYRFADEDLKL